MRTIDDSQHEILAMVYSFTSERIAEALVRASKRGVTVRMVSDRTNLHGRGSKTPMLEAAGIDVKYDLVHRIMHNKVGIFDRQAFSTGSFNWTEAAENSNAENLHVIWDAAWTQEVLTQWNELEAISVPRARAEE